MLSDESTQSNLVLASGGIESTTLIYDLAKQKKEFSLLFFDFSKESENKPLDFVKDSAKKFSVPLEVMKMNDLLELLEKYIPYEQFAGDEHDTGTLSKKPVNQKHYPSGFPLLLGVASLFSQAREGGKIYVGVEGNQIEGRPSLLSFYRNWVKTWMQFDPNSKKIQLVTPYRNYTKAEVILLAKKLDVPVFETWSCFRTSEYHCGKCPGCLARQSAFLAAELVDETIYLSKSKFIETTHPISRENRFNHV